MASIVGIVSAVPIKSARNDDDFVDRLNHRFTSTMFVMFAVVVTTKTYVGDQIKCFTPAHFTDGWEGYTDSYCWIKNTYYLPLDEYIPREDEPRQHLTYYQWVPLIMLLQSFFYYLPILVWRSMNARAGIELNSLVESGEKYTLAENTEKKEEIMKKMITQMDRYLSSQREYKTGFTVSLKTVLSNTLCLCCGRNKGNYLVVLYLFTKVIFILNCIAQFVVLNIFLGMDFASYGLDVMTALVQGQEWRGESNISVRFPRVTMCDFKIRRLGQLQTYTVQCVLPINLFNEMIYLFIWFWMVFITVFTCLSLLTWILHSMLTTDRAR